MIRPADERDQSKLIKQITKTASKKSEKLKKADQKGPKIVQNQKYIHVDTLDELEELEADQSDQDTKRLKNLSRLLEETMEPLEINNDHETSRYVEKEADFEEIGFI